MINLIDGSLKDPQENIRWVENKSSANIVLNTHSWSVGETLIIGYKSKRDDIMIGVGIKEGVGPECYRVILDKSVILVSEVLDKIPDISYYAFGQRYLIIEEDGIFLTCRYKPDESESEIAVKKTEVEERCIIMETSTGNIWICDPPNIIDFFSISTQPSLNNITVQEDGLVKIDITTEGKTYKDLCFVRPEEKSYLAEKIFERDFKAEIKSQKIDIHGAVTSSKDPCVVAKTVYTLTSTYSDKQIDLSEVPEGWTKTSTGVYTKEILGNTTNSVGPVTCGVSAYGYSGQKTIPKVTTVIDKYVFVIYSIDELTKIEGANKVFLNSTASIGKITIAPPQDYYAWFAFPITMKPTEITQLGVNYLFKDSKVISGVIKDGINLGNYIVYRSLNQGNGQDQDIIIN